MTDTFTIRFDAKTLDYIGNVLQARPWGEVNAILSDLRQQIAQQQQAQAAPVGPQEAPNGADGPAVLPAH